MVGKKTHEQEQRIIEERVNTKNADENFNAEEDLRLSEQQRAMREHGRPALDPDANPVDPDDRQMLRGVNQESKHNKKRGN